MKNEELASVAVKPAKSAKSRQANALGKTSYSQIVDTAERVLICDGYHGLSTRKVAGLCGISVGNLTYHFPNKMLLVEAVMTSVCDRYDRNRADIWRQPDSLTPRDYISNLISWMVDDAVTQETSALFLELWVLAKHHEFGSEILERFYATAVGWIAKGIESHFPEASEETRKQAAYFMLALSEGSTAVFSWSHQRSVDQKHIVKYAVASVIGILSASHQ